MRVGQKTIGAEDLLPAASPAYFREGNGVYLALGALGPILGPLPFVRHYSGSVHCGPGLIFPCVGGCLKYGKVTYDGHAVYSEAAIAALDPKRVEKPDPKAIGTPRKMPKGMS